MGDETGQAQATATAQLGRNVRTHQLLPASSHHGAALSISDNNGRNDNQVNSTTDESADSPSNFQLGYVCPRLIRDHMNIMLTNLRPTPPAVMFNTAPEIRRAMSPVRDAVARHQLEIFYSPGPGLRLLSGTTNRWVKRNLRAGRKVKEAVQSGTRQAYEQYKKYQQAVEAGADEEAAVWLSKLGGNIQVDIQREVSQQGYEAAFGRFQ